MCVFGQDSDVCSHLATATETMGLGRLTGAAKETLIEAGEAVPGWSWQNITFSTSNGQPIQE